MTEPLPDQSECNAIEPSMCAAHADQSITDEMVERAAYPIFVGVAQAPWTGREDDEPCPVKPFTKNHARNIARAALSAALDQTQRDTEDR